MLKVLLFPVKVVLDLVGFILALLGFMVMLVIILPWYGFVWLTAEDDVIE